MTDYNQLTHRWLKKQGYELTAKVEHWDAHAHVMRDLWSFIDFLAVGKGETVGVQVTARSHCAARRKKIRTSEALPVLLRNGWKILLLGIDQPKGYKTPYRYKEEWISE